MKAVNSTNFPDDSPARFSPRERRIYLAISLFLTALLTAPYLWAWLTTPSDGDYSGLLYNPDDQNVHLAWARQAHDGAFFIRDLFTTEWLQNGEKPWFFNVLTMLIGVVSRVTTLPLVIVYHVVRVLGAVACVWFFANLCAQLTNDKRVRALAVALVAFGSGIGFLQNVFPNRTFIDNANARLTMPEAWTFHSAFVFPLFIIPTALLAFIYWQTLRARKCGHWKHAVYAGIAALLLANIHTYDVVPLNVVMIVWALWSFTSSTRSARALSKGERTTPPLDKGRPGGVSVFAPLIVVAFTIPQVAYQFFVLRNSEEFRVKALSPKVAPLFLDIAISYAPYLILSICALWFLWRAQNRAHRNIEYSMSEDSRKTARLNETRPNETRSAAWIMALWVLVTLILIYTLISFARKMIEGVHLPLCFLASCGFIALLDRFRVSFNLQRVLAGALVLTMSVSSLQFVGWSMANAADVQNTSETNRRRAEVLMPPLYLPTETAKMLQFLNGLNEPRTRAVLCFPTVGNYVPRESGWPVYVGHFDETLNFEERKLGEVQRFYDGRMNAAEARRWLQNNDIGFVVVGPLERAIGNRVLDLPVAWRDHATVVYRVP